MEQHQPRKTLSPLATAIMAWAERGRITLSQATMVAKRFGVAIEEIVRGREVVDQRLEPVSKSPEEDNEAGELSKAQEILGYSTPSGRGSARPLDPAEEALNEPAAHIAG
jgi:hypothetical protein